MPRGTRFVKFSLHEDIQNDIGVTCHVPGTPSVRFSVEQVNTNSTVLTFDEGAENRQAGDFSQSWKQKRTAPEPACPAGPLPVPGMALHAPTSARQNGLQTSVSQEVCQPLRGLMCNQKINLKLKI
jgi:hypothetical protein